METHYENGWRSGWWTPEMVQRLGFASPVACLAHLEQAYQEQVAKLSTYSNRDFAAIQAEYLEGWIAAIRQSLGQMSASGSMNGG